MENNTTDKKPEKLLPDDFGDKESDEEISEIMT